MIIDNYLTEDAENYIEMEGRIVNEIISDYERCCADKDFMDFSLFDVSSVRVNYLSIQNLVYLPFLYRLKSSY